MKAMRKKYHFPLATSLVLVLLFSLGSCKKEYVLEDAPSKLEGINDSFTLDRVVQVDPLTFDVDNSLDVSTVFVGSTPAKITFNSADQTFTYDTGTSIDFIGASGTWAFDDNEYPSSISMNNGTDTYEVQLLRTIRPQDNLEFQVDRSCGGTVTVSYQYYFIRN